MPGDQVDHQSQKSTDNRGKRFLSTEDTPTSTPADKIKSWRPRILGDDLVNLQHEP